MMTALMSSGWAGTTFITDMERGVMDRMLASPVRRGALMAGQLLSRPPHGDPDACWCSRSGWRPAPATTAAGSAYARHDRGVDALGTAFGSLSNAVALLTRQQEALIGIFQFVSLPLTFLSSIMMDPKLAPHWVEVGARFNPVNWATVAARESLSATPDWDSVDPPQPLPGRLHRLRRRTCRPGLSAPTNARSDLALHPPGASREGQRGLTQRDQLGWGL